MFSTFSRQVTYFAFMKRNVTHFGCFGKFDLKCSAPIKKKTPQQTVEELLTHQCSPNGGQIWHLRAHLLSASALWSSAPAAERPLGNAGRKDPFIFIFNSPEFRNLNTIETELHRGKLRGLPTSSGLILWSPWMLDFMFPPTPPSLELRLQRANTQYAL